MLASDAASFRPHLFEPHFLTRWLGVPANAIATDAPPDYPSHALNLCADHIVPESLFSSPRFPRAPSTWMRGTPSRERVVGNHKFSRANGWAHGHFQPASRLLIPMNGQRAVSSSEPSDAGSFEGADRVDNSFATFARSGGAPTPSVGPSRVAGSALATPVSPITPSNGTRTKLSTSKYPRRRRAKPKRSWAREDLEAFPEPNDTTPGASVTEILDSQVNTPEHKEVDVAGLFSPRLISFDRGLNDYRTRDRVEQQVADLARLEDRVREELAHLREEESEMLREAILVMDQMETDEAAQNELIKYIETLAGVEWKKTAESWLFKRRKRPQGLSGGGLKVARRACLMADVQNGTEERNRVMLGSIGLLVLLL